MKRNSMLLRTASSSAENKKKRKGEVENKKEDVSVGTCRGRD